MDPRAFLDRLGRGPAPSADLTRAQADLDRLSRDRPELEAPGKSLSRLLDIAFRPADPSVIVAPDLDNFVRSWSEGTPAFRAHPPQLDESALMDRARGLAGAIGGVDASRFRDALRRRRIDLPSLWSGVFAGRPEAVEERASAEGIGAEFLASVLRLALLPSLARHSAALDPVRPEGAWPRGDCPNCGSRPLLAESRGLEQRIAHRCGLCAGDWPGERLRCPSCGESGPKMLGYSFVEGEQERFRLARCEGCASHWKVVATLTPLSPPGLLVADLATFHLDVLAQDRG